MGHRNKRRNMVLSEQASQSLVGFGQHKDKLWRNVPEDWLVWAYHKFPRSGDRWILVDMEIKRRSNVLRQWKLGKPKGQTLTNNQTMYYGKAVPDNWLVMSRAMQDSWIAQAKAEQRATTEQIRASAARMMRDAAALDSMAEYKLISGKHKGKFVRQLTDEQLKGVASGYYGQEKTRGLGQLLLRELDRRQASSMLADMQVIDTDPLSEEEKRIKLWEWNNGRNWKLRKDNDDQDGMAGASK